MHPSRLLVCLVTALCVFLIFAPLHGVNAQSATTWFSGVGDDVNPCSRTAPCQTISGTLSKTAAGGSITALDPSSTATSVVITKAITIDGGEGQITDVAPSGVPAFTIAAGTTDTVTIKNLNLKGGPGAGTYGIVLNSGNLILENVFMEGFSVAGISLAAASANVLISGTTIANCPIGISVLDGDVVTVTGSTIVQTQTGIDVSAGTTFVTNSLITQCTSQGINTTVGVIVYVQQSAITASGVGLQVADGAAVSTLFTYFRSNTESVACDVTPLVSYGNNPNFFSVPLPQSCFPFATRR